MSKDKAFSNTLKNIQLFIYVLVMSQGIVQGPEEFAEGVALGMRSLFGHAVGMYHNPM